MRVAVLCDIHGNLPALDAVLDEIDQIQVDRIVVGGDVFPGPMPCETLDRLLALDVPTDFLYGNGELGMLAQLRASDPSTVTYWGTASGVPLPDPLKEVVRWTARQLTDRRHLFEDWPKTVTLEIDELGSVLFCHATPRNETEVFTRLTPEDRLLPIFDSLGVSVVVCGHTHMQFDRMVGRTRVVNAGSVGMPFGAPGADWLLLGPTVELRHTNYDLNAAAETIRQTAYPQAEEVARDYVLQPPSEQSMVEAFTKFQLT